MIKRAGLLVAVVLLLAGVQSYAQSIEALMSQGQELLERGAFNQAVTAFRNVVSREPDNFEARFNLAFAYLQWGRNSNAIDEFKQALRYQPQNSEVWSNLAIAYENMGQSDQATGALFKAVQYNPGNTTARLNLAAMYGNANQFGKAIEQYKKAIELDGTNKDALTNLAKCLVSTGKFAEAKNYLLQAVAADPGNGEARWELGNIYWKKEKDVDKGIKEYELAIAAQPSGIPFYESLSSAYEEKGDKAQAIEILKKSMIYIDEALAKEKMQDRIDKLELGDTSKEKDAAGTKLTTKNQIDDLKKELRTKKPSETQQLETKPVNVMSDFDDLNAAPEDDNPLDLKAEAKKKAKK